MDRSFVKKTGTAKALQAKIRKGVGMPGNTGEKVILGLGGNLGDVKENISKAIELLKENGMKVIKVSSFYKTSPMGNPDQPDFINAAVLGEASLSTRSLLRICKDIEKQLGRELDAPRWSARTIDIDILFFGRHAIVNPNLIVPHPRFGERLFALIPAAEVAADFIMPDGSTIKEYFDKRTSSFKFFGQKVEKLSD